jgi:GNAT superfamily N-acetyltransferase
MRRELLDGYEIDDDRERVDVDVVHRFLAEEAYWARGRDRATIGRLVRESTRVIGVYREDQLVGFARVMSDGSNMAWLGDVFVLDGHRGRGLGIELVREAVEHPSHRALTWFLNTRDAHELYARFGFRQPNERTMVRLRRTGQPAGRSSGRSTSRGAANGIGTSSTQSGCDAISSRAPTSPCRWPASA